MNRRQVEDYIAQTFQVKADFPWEKYPQYAVFRHENSQKWFALVMDVPKDKLGLSGKEMLSIVNVKCDPLMIGALRTEQGIFPAYHMNKANWISVALDGSVNAEKIKMLLDMSFALTSSKTKERRSLHKERKNNHE